MPFNVNDFSSNLGQFGIAKPSHFNVLISLGPGSGVGSLRQRQELRGFTQRDSEHLAFRCQNAELPGRQVTTQEHRVYGPIRQFAYGVLEDDISMTFICSKNLREKVFFDEWMEYITGIVPNPSGSNRNSYNVRYYEQYVSDIVIEQFEESNPSTPSYSVKLIDAYPTSITAIELDRSQTDTFHTVTITFNFYRWERQEWRDEAMQTAAQSGLFRGLGGFVGAAAGIGAQFLPAGVAQAAGAATGIPGVVGGVTSGASRTARTASQAFGGGGSSSTAGGAGGAGGASSGFGLGIL